MQLHDGLPYPLGATETREGVNFALYAAYEDAAELHLFSLNREVLRRVPLDPKRHRTGLVWHVHIVGLPESFLYAWTINGSELLLDPYAKEVYTGESFGQREPMMGRLYLPLGLFRKSAFDWEGVTSPKLPLEDLTIYEMHVRGFTKLKGSGSYLGIIDKIPHLLSLGINAVELMPIFEFNESEHQRCLLSTEGELLNYWGYSPVSFFAPMNRYASKDLPGLASDELKTLVRELHRNKIEVLLDVVYNHTAEGNEKGPTYSFKGLAPSTYYLMDESGRFLDYSGCGNSVNCNNPITSELILASLRHFASEYHIDGFRFDLASEMTRKEMGEPLANPPIIAAINQDPVLKECKLIAEPWDAAGLYQVGSFPLHDSRWAEWNGSYRDTVRQFIRGTAHTKGAFATRLSGSEDLYHLGRNPSHSINFVTCHDGFSLRDLVSYNEKHNLMNGEENRDGINENDSFNYGVEGPTEDPLILKIRRRQEKNFLVALFLSLGTPMIRMGDEFLHTQYGNNNSYCQDNLISWIDWKEEASFLRFFKLISKLRQEEPFLRRSSFLKADEVDWHGTEPHLPTWGQDDGIIAYTLKEPGLYIAFNASKWKRLFILPKVETGKNWHLLVDTGKDAPYDIYPEGERPLVPTLSWEIEAHAILVLKQY